MKTLTIWRLAFMVLTAFSFTSCSSDNEQEKLFTTDPVEQTKFFACEASDAAALSQSAAAPADIVFTEDDIEWFNVTTREIRFKDTDGQLLSRLMENYHKEKLEFRLGENLLFEVSRFVSDIDSRILTDLVLHYSSIDAPDAQHGTFYLQDCYPPHFINDERVQANIRKNAEMWETFINYLDSRGKLRR